MIGTELKRGTAGLAILSVLEKEPLHGYEIARRIEEQSRGALRRFTRCCTEWRIAAGLVELGRQPRAAGIANGLDSLPECKKV
jgi:hypothetical protein